MSGTNKPKEFDLFDLCNLGDAEDEGTGENIVENIRDNTTGETEIEYVPQVEAANAVDEDETESVETESSEEIEGEETTEEKVEEAEGSFITDKDDFNSGEIIEAGTPASNESKVATEPKSTENAPLSLLSSEDEKKVKTGVAPEIHYADIKEPVKDLKKTLEDLRKEYAKSFPELEKKERVTWNIEYGISKFNAAVNKPLEELKAEIEKDKGFEKALKNAKKPLQMVIKPRVTGQSKGARI